MYKSKKRENFYESETGAEVKLTLQQMTQNSSYDTKSSYHANAELYPDNLITFVEKHMNYLNTHPSLNPNHYVSNLRLVTRIRR